MPLSTARGGGSQNSPAAAVSTGGARDVAIPTGQQIDFAMCHVFMGAGSTINTTLLMS